MSPTAPDSFAGGRYQVERFLGEGGKKRVYLAHDQLLDRDVAFALIKTEGLDEAALDYLGTRAEEMGALYDSLSAETLATEASIAPGLEQYARRYGFDASATVAGRLAVTAAHWADHAQQLTTFANAS